MTLIVHSAVNQKLNVVLCNLKKMLEQLCDWYMVEYAQYVSATL